MVARLAVQLLIHGPLAAYGHGHITWPPSTRHGGSLETAGRCWPSQACFWFSQPTWIPGKPKLNDKRYRTFNVDVSGGPDDWSRVFPWRAPGTAPVLGSGCGLAGGSKTWRAPDGIPPTPYPLGFDGALLPPRSPQVWRAGDTVEVAWAITANHGGGCALRMASASCPAEGDGSCV